MVQALALKGTYQKLLHGWPRSTAFEEMAELLGLGVTTIETWERAYRNTGHMQVRPTLLLNFTSTFTDHFLQHIIRYASYNHSTSKYS